MKKSIVKVLSVLFLMVSLFSISVSADTLKVGWNLYGKYSDKTVWGYMYSDGSFATGWFQDTDGSWYYFGEEGVGYSGTAYKDANGNWVDTDNTSYTIDGKEYYFDNNGKLMTNTDIYQGSGHYKYHIDNNGNIDDTYNY